MWYNRSYCQAMKQESRHEKNAVSMPQRVKVQGCLYWEYHAQRPNNHAVLLSKFTVASFFCCKSCQEVATCVRCRKRARRCIMIKFVLMVNKMGQTRVSSYYDWMPIPERVALEAEVVRRCFSRSELQCSFFEFRGYKIIYRRVSLPAAKEFRKWARSTDCFALGRGNYCHQMSCRFNRRSIASCYR